MHRCIRSIGERRAGTRRSRLATIALVAGCAASLSTVSVASATAADPARTVSLDRAITARQLGLPADAGARRLAAAALRQRAERLGLRSARDVQFDYALPDSRARGRTVRHLVFRQTSGGLPVAWSELVVHVARGRVLSINGSTVRTRRRLERAGTGAISARGAERIARAAVPRAQQTLHTQRVAWAGDPGAGRARVPREAFLIQVDQALPAGSGPGSADPHDGPARVTGAPGGDLGGSWCVVVDRASGRVLARWSGRARDPKRPPRGPSRAASTGQATARAAAVEPATPDDRPWLATIDMKHNSDIQNAGNYPFNILFLDGGFKGPDKIFGQKVFVGVENTTDATVLWVQGTAVSLLRGLCQQLKWCWPRNIFPHNWRVLGDAELGDGLGLWKINQDGYSHVHIDPSASYSRSTLAHELAHDIAVTMIGDQVNANQPGTVQEALADIGGYLINPTRRMFENIPGVAELRMDNPPIKHVSQFQCGGSGIIHANALILDLAFIRAVDATSISTMRDVYKKVIYERRLTAQSGLIDFRVAFLTAAKELFGEATRLKLNDAFISVGLQNNTPNDLGKGC